MTVPAPPPPAPNAPHGNGSPTGPSSARSTRRSPGAARRPVDADRWPDVAAPPRASRIRTAVAERIVRRALHRLPLRVEVPGEEPLGLGGPLLRLHEPGAFFARVGRSGLIGFGESYMAGEWEAPDLVGALSVLAAHVTTLVPRGLQRLRGLWALGQPRSQRNTPEGSRRNIHRHYDLSNDLFALFLDETLTYSSAVFAGFPADRSRLADAQRHKNELLLDAAGVGDGTRLLEIGTGWGELALRAAERGARVVTVTLSEEQRDAAERRVREAGLADRVEVLLRDYRQVRGAYDAVVSVEMVEAVGEEFWPVYFSAIDRLLLPGGRVALQAITMADDRMRAARGTHTWIQKYIFPGGLVPSAEAISRITAEETGLRPVRQGRYGPHYAETLRLWRERFSARADEVEALGFDETFRRMWTFYLAYSEAGFRTAYLDVQQFVLDKPEGTPGAGTGPGSRCGEAR